MKAICIKLVLFFFVSCTSVQAVIYNSYAKVTRISGTTMTVTNLTEPAGFGFASTFGSDLIIMQMQDDVIGGNTANNITFGALGSNQSAGLWEQKTISSINRVGATATVVLSTALVNSYNIGTNSSLQIISFPLLNAAAFTTTANITGTTWNGNIGGVVAFQVGTNLTLNHDVSANALGFRGGTISTNYYGGGTTCTNIDYRTNSNQCGLKGEGIYLATNTTYTYGIAKIINGGGGGGQDINGGGGGGGNWTAGGNGGAGWNGTAAGCTAPGAGGQGGISLSGLISLNRVFMGGGGGGGQQNNNASTSGGNGGGIVIIKANTLTTSCASGPRIISANGATAANTVGGGNDGGGGGGAAGSVILQIANYSILGTCQLSITANGGNGSTVTNGSTHSGGGAGGQGIVVFSIAQPVTNVTTQTNNGNPGCNQTPCSTSAGSAGGVSGSGVLSPIGGALPIELLKFYAEKEERNIKLNWSTLTEINNGYFTIEKSSDAVNFSELLRIKTKALNGNSKTNLEYSAKDISPYSGISYYRLKQTDLNGSVKYFNSISVRFEDITTIRVNVYPNPNSGEFTVDFSGVDKSSDFEINLSDVGGKIIFNRHFQAGFDLNSINLVPKEKLSSGIYICNLISEGVKFPVKVVIQ